jgi:diguanylate cyclase (GGDEF)-like protein
MSNSGQQILERVAGLTSVRDANLLDISMLRTLFELLLPQRVGLFRLEGNACREGAMWAEAPAGQLEVHAGIVPTSLLTRARMANGGRLRWVEQEAGRMIHVALFPVSEASAAATYLVVTHRDAAAMDDSRLIDAFLRFYSNYCSLLDYSQRDQLTGLLNRKTFEERVIKLLAEGQLESMTAELPEGLTDRRHTAPSYWLGMIDLDHFKRINDTFGHLYGDEVLLLTAQIMQRSFRGTDLLFRFGGEEFVVIAAGTDRLGARKAFEGLRLRIAAHVFPQIGSITASIGVVELSGSGLTPHLLDKADRALYFAKQNGRNRVDVYEDLIKSGSLKEENIATGGIELF